jgi:hypothetical protein
MRRAKFRLCRTPILPALAVSIPLFAPAALAGGGFSEPGFVQQSNTGFTANSSPRGSSVSADSVTITASGEGFSLTSTTNAEGIAGHLASAAAVWDTTTVQTNVPANVTVQSNSYTFSFDKGNASLAGGESTTVTTVVINGKIYAVAQELALALARATQFGATSAVEVEGTLTLLPGGGGVAAPVAASKSGGR